MASTLGIWKKRKHDIERVALLKVLGEYRDTYETVAQAFSKTSNCYAMPASSREYPALSCKVGMTWCVRSRLPGNCTKRGRKRNSNLWTTQVTHSRSLAYWTRLFEPQTSFHECQEMNPQDLEKLVTMPMPFGKYKGKALADLPGNYLTWFAREGFPKGEIGRLLELMHEIDHNGLSDLLKPLLPHGK